MVRGLAFIRLIGFVLAKVSVRLCCQRRLKIGRKRLPSVGRNLRSVCWGAVASREEALAVLRAPDEELLDILAAAYKLRRRWFGNTVQLYFLMNAKSGLCPEDCHYCSQSKISTAEISRYNLLSRDKLLDGARLAAERGARRTAS